MSLPARQNSYSYADYLRLEGPSQVKHEYLAGEIYAMAGGTPDHAKLAATVLRVIGSQLPKGCEAFTSDLRIRIAGADLATYPDAAVICGKTVRAVDDADAVTNPVLVVEVTSKSTEKYDRGAKLAAYKQLPTLTEVLFVSHRKPRLTLHRRESDGSWSSREAGAAESLELASVSAKIAVDEVYAAGLEDAG